MGGLFALILSFSIWAAMPTPCEQLLSGAEVKPPAKSPFLKDAARYLTGSDADAEAVFQAYKKRTGPHDPELPYPLAAPAVTVGDDLETFLKQFALDQEVFTDPPTQKWEVSKSGNWMRRLVARSTVKGKPRLIYRRRQQSGEPLVSIAHTWEDGTTKPATNRETEVAIERGKSGDWDFFVYDKGGKLTAESTFFTRAGKDITGPSPVTCLTCHYNRSTQRFTNIPASFGL
jgi:hypothetical protein